MVKKLEALTTLKRQTEQETQRTQYQALFGPLFVGLETDWGHIEQLITWTQNLGKVLGTPEKAEELLATQVDPRGYLLKTTAVKYEQWLRVTKAAEQLKVQVDSDLLVNKFVEKLFERRRSVAQLVFVLQQQLPHLSEKHIISIHSAVQNLLTAWHIRTDIEQNLFVRQLLGKNYQGIETDVTTFSAIADWISRLETVLPPPLLSWLISDETAKRVEICQKFIAKNQTYLTNFAEHRQKLSEFGDTQQWFGENTLTHIVTTTHKCQSSINSLGNLATFYKLKQEVDEMGLENLTEAITSKQIQPTHAPLHFQYAFYQNLARELIRKHAILANFTRTGYENLRQRFAELDKKVLKATRQRIAYQIAQRSIPQGNGTGRVSTFTEKCLIEHELNKKKRHIPIRQFVRRATKALQALKPCFMMSPLSVAQYLAPGQIEFDLLIMDEASQVRPEEALGAIVRCKQIVIVGDSKQLPPTQFFERLINDNEQETVLDGQESILDLALCTYQTQRLRWHYRSKHESLIAFSNHHFYEDELIIFPAPQTQGVHLNYVENATYFKGENLKEAEAVVAAIIAHFRNTPELSLGVATFNIKQQDLINEVLEKQIDTWLEAKIKATEASAEPFFIKNLENVQGDERDVIFVSTTYGPTNGRVFQRFGPISHDLGWRRLNVIFTRAKKRLELFTSLRSTDIHLDSKRGVQILKMYLEYAETGRLPDTGKNAHCAITLSKILQEQGYKTVAHEGLIGVYHDNEPNNAILGIEYDDANYHSSQSIRDRDRLRQEILERKGWKIHRIWSVDWFKNREAEIERLLQALVKEKGGKVEVKI